MKTHFLLLFALATVSEAQTRRPELPAEQVARIEAIRDARIQRARAERSAAIQKAREAGRVQARTTRARDRAFMAVWTSLTPEVQGMYAARELAERVSRRPEWKTQTRAQRIAAVTAFITNYPAIAAARPQAAMDAALGKPGAAFPGSPDMTREFASIDPPDITSFPEAEVPDLFAINRRFNWKPPHGQWMNQMLKDIDAAKAAGDVETYESLTNRYAAWAEQYLRDDR